MIVTPKERAVLSLFTPGIWYGEREPFGVSGPDKRRLKAAGLLERREIRSTRYYYRAEFMLSPRLAEEIAPIVAEWPRRETGSGRKPD
jgi:hypothetical protein